MIPRTTHNLNPFECLSAMQKFIRRGLEREAMEVAVEMGHTSKGFATWVANRLEIISHEDIGLAAPEIIPLVRTCCEQAREWWDSNKLGQWRMAIGTAIRAMCRAAKSREGDHFQAAIGLRSQLEEYTPEIPDWVQDQHTQRGRAKGRGLKYFREVSTKLEPPAEPDEYEDEAYRLWALKRQTEAEAKETETDTRAGRSARKLF
jgi:replication-associated recombination protein RarA